MSWPYGPGSPPPGRSAVATVVLVLFGLWLGAVSLMLAVLGACHDTGGWCSDDFSSQNVVTYVFCVLVAGGSGASLAAAVAQQRRVVLTGAAIGLVVGLLGVMSIEG